jgi:uncharacterized protein YndB with AHSA1/START domain
MAAKASDARLADARDFTLVRSFAAPRELVFAAFIEPEHMQHWWAPRGFSMLSCALDLRAGGAWRMRIRSDESGAVQTEVGVYKEILPPERLVFTQAWVRGNGTLTPTTLVTVLFNERDGRTVVSFHQEAFGSSEACRSHEAGWSSSLELLTEHIDGRRRS